MPTTPVAIPAPGLPLPDPSDKLTFSARKLEDLRWSREDAVPGMEALADVTYDNAVEAAASAVSAASGGAAQVALATAQATAAAASALTALNAPGTSGTSTTSTVVGAGSKTLTIQTGKALVVGQSITLARTSDPAGVRMFGPITGYNSGTGVLSFISSPTFIGSGTFTDWTVSLGAFPSSNVLPIVPITSSGAAASTVNTDILIDADNVALAAPTSKAVGDLWQWQLMNNRTGCSADFSSDKFRGRTPGVIPLTDNNARAKLKWSGSTYGWVEA
jgi:hypothetical protein